MMKLMMGSEEVLIRTAVLLIYLLGIWYGIYCGYVFKHYENMCFYVYECFGS